MAISIPYFSEIVLRTGEHLILVAVAMTLAMVIAIPLGIYISKKPQLARPILGIANAIQTVPSLAIFGFLLTVPIIGGIGKTPAIVALTLYALLPLIRNTYTGIAKIDRGTIEAAKALGMKDRQILLLVEIPLASGIILAGVRVATVICVGIATIAAAIGGGGLGVFIFRGLSTVNNQLILTGAIPATLIALSLDFALGLFEKSLTQRGKRNSNRFKYQFALLLGFVTLLIFLIIPRSNQQITIGSKNFTEQVILGEILATEIEANTNLKVQRQFNLGGTFICHNALVSGAIDGYVEYTGTAFTAILNQKTINNPQLVYNRVKKDYAKKFDLEVMPSLGFENTFAILIRRQDAENLQIKTISEAAQYTSQWQAGFGYEFINREDGYPGLSKTYDLQFSEPPLGMDLSLTYRALADRQVDMIAGDSTNGLITVLNLFMLEDNKQYFPPYQAVPIFNKQTLTKYPEVKTAIAQLDGKISSKEMRKMNYQVDSESIPVKKVVEQFLIAKGLISQGRR